MIQLGNGKFEGWRALLMAGILVAGCCAFNVPANAQAQGGMGQRGGNVEQQLSELTQALGLTVDQQAQVKALLEARRAKMEALRAGGEQPSREQMMAARQETNDKIRALLNDDQKIKFAAWEQQRMQRRGQGGGAPPAAQPPGF